MFALQGGMCHHPHLRINFAELMQYMMMHSDEENRMEQRRHEEREELEDSQHHEQEEAEERYRHQREEAKKGGSRG